MPLRLPRKLPPRRLMILLIPVGLAVFLASVFAPKMDPFAPEHLAHVRPGMSTNDLKSVLGPPNETTRFGGAIHGTPVSTDTWIYTGSHNRKITFTFSDGALTGQRREGF